MSVFNNIDHRVCKKEPFASNGLIVCGQFITSTFLTNE
jgi:hypothetical protein